MTASCEEPNQMKANVSGYRQAPAHSSPQQPFIKRR
jgi:hypothetical protein